MRIAYKHSAYVDELQLTFTLMGIPKVEVSVQPMMKAFPNVLDLPIISGFVQSSIAVSLNCKESLAG